jgi:hypothetical protein
MMYVAHQHPFFPARQVFLYAAVCFLHP